MAKVTRLPLENSAGQEHRRLHLREISDGADSPLETVGLDLRKARLRKGEDLAQVARALKIRKDYLDALEESRFEALPGHAYAIGFVRTYADYLGLDQVDCVERLKAEIAGRGDMRAQSMAISHASERKLPQGGLILIGLLAIMVLGAGYYLFSSFHSPFPSITPVPARLASEAGSQRPSQPPIVVPVPTASIAKEAPAEPSVTDSAAPTSSPPALADSAAIAAGSRTTQAAAAPVEAPLPKGITYGAQNRNSRITLRVHRVTRVTVLGLNNRLFLDRALQPGDSYLIPNMTGLTLTALDGGAVELILDGGSMGYATKDGMPVQSLSLNPQDVVDREQHP